MRRSWRLYRSLSADRAQAANPTPMTAQGRQQWLWAYYDTRTVTPRWVLLLHDLDAGIARKRWTVEHQQRWRQLLDDELKRITVDQPS